MGVYPTKGEITGEGVILLGNTESRKIAKGTANTSARDTPVMPIGSANWFVGVPWMLLYL